MEETVAITTEQVNNPEQQEENINKVHVILKTTSTGFTININKNDTKLWHDTLINYFNGLETYEVEETKLDKYNDRNKKHELQKEKRLHDNHLHIDGDNVSTNEKMG